MAVRTLGRDTNTVYTLGTPVTPISGVPVKVVGSNIVSHVYTEIDPVFDAWDKSSGISIEQSQITDGDTIVNLEDWEIRESDDGLSLVYDDQVKTIISKGGGLKSGGIRFEICLVRNQELDNTLSIEDSTLLTISDKTGQVITVNNLPDYYNFDQTGWVAMLSDTAATTTSPDPNVTGDYSHKYFCTVDRSAKTLTFDGAIDLTAWAVDASLVLYNPFINYNFVTDQTLAPIVDISGAPAWRAFQTYSAPMYRHSDGRFIMLINGFSDGTTAKLGYAYSYDMDTWTMGNADAPVWDPAAEVPLDCILCQFMGSALPLNDGTGRLYMVGTASRFDGLFGYNEPFIVYFDEDLTTFTYSSYLFTGFLGNGYAAGSPILINGVYHLPVLYIQAGDTRGREARIYTSTSLEGPYSLYQALVKGTTANNGVAWSYGQVGVPTLCDDGIKKFGLFDGVSWYSQSGTKGNRELSYIEYNEETELWEVGKQGPVIINPMYFNGLDGTYNWCQDHGGNSSCIFTNAGKAYLSTHFRGTVPAKYQVALVELNYENPLCPTYVPYDGAEKDIDLNTRNLTTTGTITADNVSGDNTGDQDLSGLVPYTGATGNVTLGVNRVSAANMTVANLPVNGTDVANKTYVDSIIAAGISWKAPVLDILTPLPGGAGVGDRYIDSSDDSINEWNGASWDSTAAVTGDAIVVTPGGTAAAGWYTYDGAAWLYLALGMAHNDTTGLQGGNGVDEFYHLSDTAKTEIEYVIEPTADSVPTGLAMDDTGISIGSDGSVFAYVVLSWDAIVSDTFDVYGIRYKQDAQTYYNTGLTTNATTITIDGLATNTDYDFAVCSINKRGTPSAYCADITETTASNTTAPGDVTTTSATEGIQYVILRWDPVTNKDISHYIIYRHTANVPGSSSAIGTTKGTYFLDGGRTGGTALYYWVKAVNTSGIVSANYSNGQTATPRNVVSLDTALAHQGWVQTCAFTVTDADTVAWGAGTLTTSAGVTYNIDAGNTGNMAAKTYIYLNTAVSTTAYQTTTTASTAVGDTKILVAVAENGTGEATFFLLNNKSMNINAAEIVAGSITTNEIATGTIKASNIDTDNITSLANLTIGAPQVTISGAVTLANWQGSGGSITKINGGEIATNTISASAINFTIANEDNIVGTINASTEGAGILIDAARITINGNTNFEAIGTNGEVRIFPDANTGIQIVDNAAADVFKAVIDGTHVGDVIIGNYSGGQGIFYDKSEASTTFKGTIYADGAIYSGQQHTVRKAASNNQRHTSAGEVSSTGVKEVGKSVTFTNGFIGTFNCSFTARYVEGSVPAEVGYVGVFKNNTLLTTDDSGFGYGTLVNKDVDQIYTETISTTWSPGDVCEIRMTSLTDVTTYVNTFWIGYDDNPIVEVSSSVYSK